MWIVILCLRLPEALSLTPHEYSNNHSAVLVQIVALSRVCILRFITDWVTRILCHVILPCAGRSNVGKSSLINALSRRWGVARTSEKPGLTQSINFFTFGSQLCLVDLPGYGFAYAKEEKKEEWEELVKYYVQTRANLKRVCVLVDAKWGLKPRDEELLHLMESAGTRFQIVVTKTDILPPVDLARRATQILQVLENHRCLVRPLVMVSSKTGAGLQLFRASLASIAPSQSRFLQEDNL